jgi:hypothetical protein
MPTLNLKNISIDERQTISGETYFLIKIMTISKFTFVFSIKLKKDEPI